MDAIYDHLLDLVKAPSQTCQERVEAFQLALRDPIQRVLSHDITEDLVAAWFLAIAARIPETLPTPDDYAASLLFIECLPAKEATHGVTTLLYLLWLPPGTQNQPTDDSIGWNLPILLAALPDKCYFWASERLSINAVDLEFLLPHLWEAKRHHRADPWIERMLADPNAADLRDKYARLALSHGYWDVYERCKSDDYDPYESTAICQHGEALARGRFRIASERLIAHVLVTKCSTLETEWLVNLAEAGWHDLVERLIGSLSPEQHSDAYRQMLEHVLEWDDEPTFRWIVQKYPMILSDDGLWKSCLWRAISGNRLAILRLLLTQRSSMEPVNALGSWLFAMPLHLVNIIQENYAFSHADFQTWLKPDAKNPLAGAAFGWLMPCIGIVNVLWSRDLVVQWGDINEPTMFSSTPSVLPEHQGLFPYNDRDRRVGSEARRYDLWMPMLRSMEARVCWTLGAVLLVTDDYFGVLVGSSWQRYISILSRLPFDLQIVVSRRVFGLNGVGYERALMNAVLKKLLAFLNDAFWSNKFAIKN